MPRTHRRPYPSDLSDAEWALLEPLLASPERRGRPPKWPARRVADAVFYLLLRSGCAWRMLPREYPPWQTVYYHFLRRWRLDGRLRRAHDALRAEVRAREGTIQTDEQEEFVRRFEHTLREREGEASSS